MQMQVQLRTLTCALAMMLGLAGCADDDGPGSLSEGSKIGRASCRERVSLNV